MEFYKDTENKWRWRRTAPNGNMLEHRQKVIRIKVIARGMHVVTDGRIIVNLIRMRSCKNRNYRYGVS